LRNRGSVMEMVELGETELMVSQLCFGTGHLDHIGQNFAPERGGGIAGVRAGKRGEFLGHGAELR